MKKTLTANISGTVFHIEEDAFDALQRYLDTIRARFSGERGADEIMGDIESRIAELFSERLDGRGQVVTMADVQHVISVMGKPEDYAEEDGHQADAGQRPAQGPRRRRLFRDPDDRWLGGVLGGLAAYIGTDPLWLRLIFIFLIILGVGSPILVYLVMWILVPPANTPAERLMMEGEPVTVDNLKKAFEEGGRRMAREVEDLGERWSNDARGGHAFRRGMSRGASAVGTVIAKIVGIFLLVLGMSLGLGLVGSLIGGGTLVLDTLDSTGAASTMDLGGLLFASDQEAIWAIIALCLILLIPTIALLQAGVQLLFDLGSPRWLGWTMATTWVIALVVFSFLAIRLANDFKRAEPLRTDAILEQPRERVLHLGLFDGDEAGGRSWRVAYSRGRIHWELDGLVVDGDSVQLPLARLDVRRSPDERFHLRVERRTQGRSHKASQYRSANIVHRWEQRGDTLLLSPWMRFPASDKLRAQRLRYIVLVPEGSAVHIGTDIGSMLDDVDNVTNTLDRDMVGRTWTMTPQGLDADAKPDTTSAPKPETSGTQEARKAGLSSGSHIEQRLSKLGDRLPRSSRLTMLPDLFAVLRLPGKA